MKTTNQYIKGIQPRLNVIQFLIIQSLKSDFMCLKLLKDH